MDTANTAGQPSRTAKADLLGNSPVFQNTAVCRQIYTPEIGLSGLHFHEFIEVSIVTEGIGLHRIFNDVTECRCGDIYIMNTGVPHGYFAKSATECPTVCNLLFDAGDWFSGAEACPDDPHFCYGVFRDNPSFAYALLTSGVLDEVMHLYDSVAQEAAAQRADWQNAVRAYITLLLITTERYGSCTEQCVCATRNSSIVSAALRLATEHLGDADITLETIAQTLHLSKSHLSRIFRQVTGTLFSDHMQHIRVLHACHLLTETNLSNAQIAQRCGVRDLQTFYNFFRKRTGMTPHQYRTAQHCTDTAPDAATTAEQPAGLFRSTS